MKIISKYKDFYDYLVQDYDSDLTYVREICIVNEYFDKLFYREDNSCTYFSKYYGYQDPYISRKDNGSLSFGQFIFGIYPFVYLQPILIINYRRYETNMDSEFIILGKDLVDRLLDSSQIVSQLAYEEELITMAQKEFDKLCEKNMCKYEKVHYYMKSANIKDILKTLKRYVWKVDCPELFYKLRSPVFVKYYNSLFANGPYLNNWPKKAKISNDEHIHYVTDISFQKLNYNILKYWYNDLFDINTYINIENFLWSIKQEPIANPDNKTKIIAHGFDLKTSFRKM